MVTHAKLTSDRLSVKMKNDASSAFAEVIERVNPNTTKTMRAAVGKVFAIATAKLSVQLQYQSVANEKIIAQALEKVLTGLVMEPAEVKVPQMMVVERSEGASLGKALSIEAGRQRLAELSTPMRLEDWAGPVGGPSEIERRFGTKRSTLHDWQRRGAVIGLLKGQRKHVFPLAQFVDGRPVEGMTELTEIVKNHRVAWQWLIRSKPSIGGTPLDRLKLGKIKQVISAAERDFG